MAAKKGRKKNPHAIPLGRLGSEKGAPLGGRARMESLTEEERSALARKAAHARWAKSRRKPP